MLWVDSLQGFGGMCAVRELARFAIRGVLSHSPPTAVGRFAEGL